MSTRGSTRRVTLREVADVAGVHPATVSRALNPDTAPMVQAETLQKVLNCARELNYRTNRIARSLRTQRSHTVGVLIPDITNPLFPHIVRGIEDTLVDAHFTSLIAYTDGRDDRVRDRLELLRERGVDGLIIATARRRDRVIDGLHAEGLPMVLINRRTNRKEISSVTANDAGGAEQAVAHLVAGGHRRIAFLGAPQNLSTGHARFEGYQAALRSHGLEVDPAIVSIANAVTIAEGARVCKELLASHPDITAIVAANDLMALGCYDAISAAGLSVPEDVSVIGFNDMPFADRFDPPMTTVRFEHYDMGAFAARILINLLSSEETGPSHLQLETRLAVRGSTALRS